MTENLINEVGIKNLRCIHRHKWPDHKSCFLKGRVILAKENTKKAFEIKPDKSVYPWYADSQFKVGYLDIETDNLKANFGTMLSWAIKERGGAVTSCVITKADLFSGTIDKQLVKALVDEMSKYSVIVTYYGTGFDLKFIRSKALHYGIPFPQYKWIYHLDLYYRVKSLLCLSSNSLQTATEYLGIAGKTKLDYSVWGKAKYGEPNALAVVLDHNIQDVLILEKLHDKLQDYSAWIKKSI